MEFVEEETYATATQVDAPWHLDILDQESIMFNGLYSPIGDGDGVDIYILDTGTIHVRVHGKFSNSGFYISMLKLVLQSSNDDESPQN